MAEKMAVQGTGRSRVAPRTHCKRKMPVLLLSVPTIPTGQGKGRSET